MTVPIVFAADENYAPYCAVAVTSLIQNADPQNHYAVYILFDRLSVRSIRLLEQLSCDYVQVRCWNVHREMCAYHLREYVHISAVTNYRFLIARLFAQYQKVIYLDCDIIVLDDLAHLFEIPLDDCILGAVKGKFKKQDAAWMRHHLKETLSIAEEHFFNAGILLIQTSRFREEMVEEKAFAMLTTRDDLPFMDQDALNIICENHVRYLPEYWNFECGALERENACYTDESAINCAESVQAGILHFDGTEKPWDDPETPYAEVFWACARQTPFYETLLKKMYAHTLREAVPVVVNYADCKRVVVYGAGNAGQRLVRLMQLTGVCRVVGWIDQNWAEKTGLALPVGSLDTLSELEYDHLIIAIENGQTAESVEQELLRRGVDKASIRCI